MKTRLCLRLVVVGAGLATRMAAFGQAQTGATPGAPATGPAPASQVVGGANPRLEITPAEFDFGQVWQGEPAKREFTIKNTGDAPMTITLKSTCGCTVATNPKTPLAAGESTTFSITYDTTRPGAAHKTVIVTTNDPARPTLDIAVKGEVKPLYTATPSENIVFQDLEPSSIETQTIKLETKYERPLNLKLKEGQDFGPFEIAFREVKAGAEYHLTATTKPPLRFGGKNRATVVLETGLEKTPTVSILVVANAQPRVLVMPTTLAVAPDTTPGNVQPVRVQYRTNTPIKITEVKAIPESVKYEIVPPPPPQGEAKTMAYTVRVTLPAFADIPDDGGKVEIFTDDKSPEYQHFTIPIVKRAAPVQRPVQNPVTRGNPPASQPAPPSGGNPK